jgi:hypothetical protein
MGIQISYVGNRVTQSFNIEKGIISRTLFTFFVETFEKYYISLFKIQYEKIIAFTLIIHATYNIFK